MMEFSIFDEVIDDPQVEIDEKQTIQRARYVLSLYKKKLYRQANIKQDPQVTSQLSLTPPTFSSGLSDQMAKRLEVEETAQDIITAIFKAINQMYVTTAVPTLYYRQLLYYRFLDFEVHSVIAVRERLAGEFPRRIEYDYNPVMLDKHVYYHDERQALIAFAQAFHSEHAQESLVVYR